jgi:hypothetical protein
MQTLKALITLMKQVWPRVPCHKSEIIKILLKLVSDLCPQEDLIPKILRQLELLSECLSTLQLCCDNVEDVYRSLQRDCGNHRGLQFCLETSLKNVECRQ